VAGVRTGLALALAVGCLGSLVGIGIAVGPAGATGAAETAAARAPAHILVYAQEWSLWSSRGSLPSGRVSVQMWNRGQDAHDLRIRRVGAGGRMIGSAQALSVTSSGALGTARWRLRPGRYELYCSLSDHRARGMHTTLRVR
jgi:hypothetical protein